MTKDNFQKAKDIENNIKRLQCVLRGLQGLSFNQGEMIPMEEIYVRIEIRHKFDKENIDLSAKDIPFTELESTINKIIDNVQFQLQIATKEFNNLIK